MEFLSNLLSNNGFIMVNKTAIKTLGLHEAIILGELCSEYNYWKTCNKLIDGMFYSTRENIENNTGLSAHFQRKAIETLKSVGILTVIKKGCPAINYYKLDFTQLSITLTSCDSSCEQQEIKSVNLNNNNNKNKEKEDNSKELYNTQNFIQSNLTQKEDVNSVNSFLGSNQKKEKKLPLNIQWKNIIDDFTDNQELKDTIWEYVNMYNVVMQDKHKILYANVLKGKLNELKRISDNITNQIKILQYSISNGWITLYDVTKKESNRYQKFDVTQDCGKSVKYTKKELEEQAKWEKEMIENGESISF